MNEGSRTRVIAHIDHGTPWYFRKSYPIGESDLRAAIKLFAGTAVDTISFDAAVWCCWYDTKVGERYGAIGPPFRDAFDLIQYESLNRLIEEGNDIPKVYADEAHAQQMKCIASIRMNDGHHEAINRGYATMPKATRWYLSHPEWRIQDLEGSVAPEYRHAQMRMLMDYTFAGVRNERLAIVKELANSFHIDGIELNFMRLPFIFPPGKGERRASILTDFVHSARDLLNDAADVRGVGRLQLGIRVPEDVNLCRSYGYDLEALSASQCLDYIVADPWRTLGINTNFEEFAAITRGRVQLLAGMDAEASLQRPEMGLPPGRFGGSYLPSSAMMRAAACNALASGADGIGSFNSAAPTKFHGSVDRELWSEMGELEKLQRSERTYLFSGEEPEVLPPDENGTHRALTTFRYIQLPGDEQRGFVQFRLINGLPGDEVEIRLNDVVVDGWNDQFLLGWSLGRTIVDDPMRQELPAHTLYRRALAGLAFNSGSNELQVTLTRTDARALRAHGEDRSVYARAGTSTSFIRWVAEVEIVVTAESEG